MSALERKKGTEGRKEGREGERKEGEKDGRRERRKGRRKEYVHVRVCNCKTEHATVGLLGLFIVRLIPGSNEVVANSPEAKSTE